MNLLIIQDWHLDPIKTWVLCMAKISDNFQGREGTFFFQEKKVVSLLFYWIKWNFRLKLYLNLSLKILEEYKFLPLNHKKFK